MRRLVLLATALVAAGCQDNQGADFTLPETETNVVGSYSLAVANGGALPFNAIVTATEIWTLTSDKIILLPDNSWVDTTRYTVTNRATSAQAPQMTSSAGTYAIADGQINFVMTSGGSVTFVGSVYQNNLAVNFGSSRYVYTR